MRLSESLIAAAMESISLVPSHLRFFLLALLIPEVDADISANTKNIMHGFIESETNTVVMRILFLPDLTGLD